jgi:hypothetical protein
VLEACIVGRAATPAEAVEAARLQLLDPARHFPQAGDAALRRSSPCTTCRTPSQSRLWDETATCQEICCPPFMRSWRTAHTLKLCRTLLRKVGATRLARPSSEPASQRAMRRRMTSRRVLMSRPDGGTSLGGTGRLSRGRRS